MKGGEEGRDAGVKSLLFRSRSGLENGMYNLQGKWVKYILVSIISQSKKNHKCAFPPFTDFQAVVLPVMHLP